jgi:hypothetical protein
MKHFLTLAALAATSAASPAMAQAFEKEQQSAAATTERMQTVAAQLQSSTRGATAAEMRRQFNKPAARQCHEHGDNCVDCAHHDCADCPHHKSADAHECTDCPGSEGGMCTPKGHG